MFYINFNLDRVYYFDHTHINTEPYNLPVSPDSNRILIIRFDIIINDPIELARLIEWSDNVIIKELDSDIRNPNNVEKRLNK